MPLSNPLASLLSHTVVMNFWTWSHDRVVQPVHILLTKYIDFACRTRPLMNWSWFRALSSLLILQFTLQLPGLQTASLCPLSLCLQASPHPTCLPGEPGTHSSSSKAIGLPSPPKQVSCPSSHYVHTLPLWRGVGTEVQC